MQLGRETHQVRACVAQGDEREQLWDEMAAIYSDYNEYKAVTEREIPVVVLEKV